MKIGYAVRCVKFLLYPEQSDAVAGYLAVSGQAIEGYPDLQPPAASERSAVELEIVRRVKPRVLVRWIHPVVAQPDFNTRTLDTHIEKHLSSQRLREIPDHSLSIRDKPFILHPADLKRLPERHIRVRHEKRALGAVPRAVPAEPGIKMTVRNTLHKQMRADILHSVLPVLGTALLIEPVHVEDDNTAARLVLTVLDKYLAAGQLDCLELMHTLVRGGEVSSVRAGNPARSGSYSDRAHGTPSTPSSHLISRRGRRHGS